MTSSQLHNFSILQESFPNPTWQRIQGNIKKRNTRLKIFTHEVHQPIWEVNLWSSSNQAEPTRSCQEIPWKEALTSPGFANTLPREEREIVLLVLRKTPPKLPYNHIDFRTKSLGQKKESHDISRDCICHRFHPGELRQTKYQDIWL